MKTIPDFIFGRDYMCTYCGEPATCIDHCVPWTYISSTKRNAHSSKRGLRTYACHDCNSFLTDTFHQTFMDRCVAVSQHWHKLLEKKFAKTPNWTEKELAQLDSNLRTFVESELDAMRRLRNRASFIGSKAFDKTLADLRKRPEFDVNSSLYSSFLYQWFFPLHYALISALS